MEQGTKNVKPFPAAPKTLKKVGKETWKLGRPLWQAGTLDADNLHAWRRYCELVEEIEHCKEVEAREGEYTKTKNGAIIQHPVINRRKECEKTMWRLHRDFGILRETKKKEKAAPEKGVARRPKNLE